MTETRVEMKVIQVDKTCPECGEGKMRNDGFVLTSNPPMYPSHCTNEFCDYRERYAEKRYPYLEYEPKQTKGERE
ncbi:hypothetical protein GWO43_30240 [candidate division KSB1 bacterium]|nr:hypothetical protein [candidate division KSB1 bacterium]NIV70638.1 hypothetical protein [Phycisphaerae bacterium]NIS28171.1 hypothetical protein [candidate division KSB1 bacterium]NIT75063.1 hypothetical protein [candidate division KSB1 bacterium]NIU28849.1 hypothetical protein [candidate division KSB1 bacterium]